MKKTKRGKWGRAFWEGVLNALDLSAVKYWPNCEAPKDGFQQDWDNIGKDFRKVIKDE